MTRGRVRERGVALVTTLLAVTLLTIAVVEFAYSSQVDYHLAYNALRSLQASSLARSGVNLAIGVLQKDGGSVSNIDSLGDLWARPLPPLPVGEGMVLVRVTDEQGKLNLNALRTPSGTIDLAWRGVAERLFVIRGVDPALLEPILDWLDTDDAPEPHGAEREYYSQLTPPTAPRNAPFMTEGELGRVKGLTAQVRGRLSDVVTVLPTSPRINVNTAPPEVLSALLSTVDQKLLDLFLTSRGETPVRGANDFQDRLGLLRDSKAERMISVRSDFFTIVALATVEPVSQALTVRVKRQARTVTLISWQTTLPVTERG
ncbi:MAG: general secretion pathway protein GspK [Deltaproteobacteria bacterium]|nr:general secretion pathway protein GspK [Deltaproteobacteria bacterium]